jgi:hypothetical protein
MKRYLDRSWWPMLIVALGVLSASAMVHAASATGPLRVGKENPRYFTDGAGKAIYLKSL